MPNQMIALQARAPQTDVLGSTIQRNAQMMNMMSQQRSAERQAAKAEQEMQLAQAKASRDASAADIEQAGKLIDLYTKRAGQTMNAAGYNLLLRDMEKDSPEIAEAFRANLPPEKFDRNLLLQMVGSIGDNFKATYGPLETEVVFDENGNAFVSVTGGFSAEKGTQGMYPLTTRQLKRRPAAPVAGAPAQPSGGIVPAGGFRPTRDVNTTPADLRAQATPQAVPATPEQLDAAARAVARGAKVSDPMLRDLSESDFLEVQKRASRLMQNSPEFQTMSAGGAAQPDLAGIVQTMMDTGVVSQSNLEAMRAAAGPGKDAQLAEILRSNNIRIMPDEQPAGGMRSAVYRPGEGDAGMTRVQALEEYEDTGRQFKGKSPLVSPSTPSKTPEQIYREEKAREKAKVDAAREAGPKPLTPVQEARLRDNIAKDYKAAQSTLDMMLNPVTGVVATVQSVRNLTDAQKEAITGFSGYIPSVTASSREADTKVKNLMGKVTEMGKAAASLNGAIGQMAVQEWRIVRDMIANLDLEGMEPSDLDNQLDIIETQARRAAAITQDAYENQYIEEFARYPNRFQLKAPGAAAQGPRTNTSNLPRVRNDADFNRLKPGTLFIDPNGETRRKP